MKNEQVSMEKNSRHKFPCVLQVCEQIVDCVYVPFFSLQTPMEYATEVSPWHAHMHTHSLIPFLLVCQRKLFLEREI